MKLIICIILSILPCSLSAEIYKWTDENGKVHFGDKKSSAVASEEISVSATNSSAPIKVKKPVAIADKKAMKKQSDPVKEAKRWERKHCIDGMILERFYHGNKNRCIISNRIPVAVCDMKLPSKFIKYIFSPAAFGFAGGDCASVLPVTEKYTEIYLKEHPPGWTPK